MTLPCWQRNTEHHCIFMTVRRWILQSSDINPRSLRTTPTAGSVTYAGKAFLNLAIAQWTQLHNLFVDCTGEGEIAIAVAGGVPREHIVVHGVNKSAADLASAMKYAGTIVVDNLTELHRIASQFPITDFQFPNLWLRLLPGHCS